MTSKWNANYIETMPFSDTCVQVGLSVSSEHTFTVPGMQTDQYQAYFEYASNSNVFICLNGTPVVPALGSVGTQPYNEFKPKKRYVRGGDVIHFITPDSSAYVGVSLRQIQG
jgi:plastocyanin